MIPVTVKNEGKLYNLMLEKGQKLIEQLHKNKIPINDACEGNLGCGTCHIQLDEKTFDKLEEAGEQEEDLLQFVPGLKPTSRLACAITVNDSLTNAVINIPELNRNLLSEHDLVAPK